MVAATSDTRASGCAALHGLNRNHAIFGWSESCVATNPSDLAVALAAMDALVIVRGKAGERQIPFTDFHRLPGDAPERDNVLDRGDLIVAIEVPASVEARASHYLKVRDRASYEFALVSAAAAVATDGGRISSARLAMGGVAHKPWRLTAAETSVRGISLADVDGLRSAIATSFDRCPPACSQCLQGRTGAARRAARLANSGSTPMNAVGQPISRIDGRLKVTGGARYTADIPVEAIVHGAIVYSTIANGRIVSIDTTAAENAPGVLDVLTHRNMPRMNAQSWSHLRPQGQTYLPLQDDQDSLCGSASRARDRRHA